MIGTLFIRVDRNQSAPRLILKYTWYTRLFTKYTDSYLYLLHRNRKWRKIYWFLIGLGTLCWHWRSIFVVIFFFSLNTFYVCHKMKIYDNDHIMFVYSSYRFACGKGNTKLKSRTVSRGEWFYQNHKHIDMTLMNRKILIWPSRQCIQILTTGVPKNFLFCLYRQWFGKIWKKEKFST